MNKSFVKELVITNYLLIGGFVAIIVFINLLHGGTLETWSKSFGLLVVLAVVMMLKVKKIKGKKDQLDERVQYITYRAISVGFYLMLLTVFWFYTMELVVEGAVSLRTVVEMLAGMAGYLGAFAVLNSRY